MRSVINIPAHYRKGGLPVSIALLDGLRLLKEDVSRRRGARVGRMGASFISCCLGNRTVGSNPTLSAITEVNARRLTATYGGAERN